MNPKLFCNIKLLKKDKKRHAGQLGSNMASVPAHAPYEQEDANMAPSPAHAPHGQGSSNMAPVPTQGAARVRGRKHGAQSRACTTQAKGLQHGGQSCTCTVQTEGFNMAPTAADACTADRLDIPNRRLRLSKKPHLMPAPQL